jgi:Putative transmembrane protein (PGPGW)
LEFKNTPPIAVAIKTAKKAHYLHDSKIAQRLSQWKSACMHFLKVCAREFHLVFRRTCARETRTVVIVRTIQQAKRLLKILIGFTLLALGIVMVATPGPGALTIILALGVLAAEFVWARRLLDRVKEQGVRLRATVFSSLDRA